MLHYISLSTIHDLSTLCKVTVIGSCCTGGAALMRSRCVFGKLGFRLLFSIVRACAGFEIFRGFLFRCGKDAVRGFAGDGEIYGCRVLIDVDRAERSRTHQGKLIYTTQGLCRCLRVVGLASSESKLVKVASSFSFDSFQRLRDSLFDAFLVRVAATW